MGAISDWLIGIEEKTAELLVTMSGGALSENKALEMVRDEFERVDFDYMRVDFNVLVDGAMGIVEGGKRTRYLHNMRWEFEDYMRPDMWNKVTADGVYEDNAWVGIDAFFEFCECGYVTDVEEHPFFVDAKGNVHDYYAAVNLMDEELREELHRSMSHDTPQEFIERYAEKHLEKFGEGFAPYDGGAW